MRRLWPVSALRVVLIVLAVAAFATRAQAQANASPCDIHTTERVVAVGDVHGGYEQFANILRAAGLIDRRDRWSGGRALLVQTGDVLDRGADSRKVIDLLRRLERDAARAGGRVYPLLGNHEFMRLIGDWRYVSAGEYTAFSTKDSTELRERAYELLSADAARRAREEKREHDDAAYREQFMRDVPLGSLEMQFAFAATGDYGKWVRARPAVVKINGVLFLHGGISETVASLGCAGINAKVAQELASLPLPPEQLSALLATSETGPLWYRGLASEPEETFAPTVNTILEAVQARAIVVGHTPAAGKITTRFGGRVIQIDTGMLNGEFYPNGAPAALELRGDTLTAIYLDRREPVVTGTPEPAEVPASR